MFTCQSESVYVYLTVISTVLLKLKDFWRSETVCYTVISRKRYNISLQTLLLQISNRKWYIWPIELVIFDDLEWPSKSLTFYNEMIFRIHLYSSWHFNWLKANAIAELLVLLRQQTAFVLLAPRAVKYARRGRNLRSDKQPQISIYYIGLLCT